VRRTDADRELAANIAALLAVCNLGANAQVKPASAGAHAQQLKSLSLSQLGEIEVTTQSKGPTEVWITPAPIYVLTAKDIRRSGVTNIPASALAG
jgi:hypothetical protein